MPSKRADAPRTPPLPAGPPHEPHVTNGAEATNLPPESDMPDVTDAEPTEVIKRAKKDLDEGQVDTDMRSTPGLDAARKAKLLKDDGQR